MKDEFPCPGEEIICMPLTWVCDGIADCNGAEDEDADTCGNYFDSQLHACKCYQILICLIRCCSLTLVSN